MDRAVPQLSLWDNLLFNLGWVVPMGLQGSFTRNRFWVGVIARVHPDPAAVRFVDRLRAKYRREYLYVRMLTTKSLLVLDPAGVRHVLDRSPMIYADGKPKRDGMRVFQPHAVTISRGEDWRDRRRFNEAVLDSGRPVHADADAILAAVREEVEALGGARRPRWTWSDVDQVFARIMRRVIFGRSARDDETITDLLHMLLREANRPIKPKRSRHFMPFYRRIAQYLERADPGSLAARCGLAPITERTRVAEQIPHWMFAMWETLGANTVRALTAILSHPEAEERVRRELSQGDPTTSAGVARLAYLAACIQDAMRLWPTTPMLIRETVAEDTLGGATVPRGTQVLIWNSFNHRDQKRYPLADTFSPDAWAEGTPSPLFNHLSSGPQVCAGVDLVLFISRAVIATLLSGSDYVVVRPRLDPAQPLPYAFYQFSFQMVTQ
jgi:cytochrome P450